MEFWGKNLLFMERMVWQKKEKKSHEEFTYNKVQLRDQIEIQQYLTKVVPSRAS